jgi:hypothetical protein
MMSDSPPADITASRKQYTAGSDHIIRFEKVDAHSYSPIELAGKSQRQSVFLQLPLEVRNQIYADAFSGWSMIFTHGRIDVIARDSRYWRKRKTRPRGQRVGLPSWMRSCKQITAEALEVIARTWNFESSSPISNRPEVNIDNGKPNLLVFHRGVMRNIAVREPLDSDCDQDFVRTIKRHLDIEEPIHEFLGILKHQGLENACLELEWTRWWHRAGESDPFWYAPHWGNGEPEIYTVDWDDWWNGKFRKVRIVVYFWDDPDNGHAAAGLVEVAEACAKRLTGPGGKTSSEGKYFEMLNTAEKIWRRKVTVERRV